MLQPLSPLFRGIFFGNRNPWQRHSHEIKPMKYRSEAFLLSLGFLALPLSAEASTVQNLSASEAENGIAPVINVCKIDGYNLSFLKVKGGVVQANLVDPSRTHVSFDVEKPSAQSPAKVVYLRHINPLKFQGLPAAKDGQMTTLSVLTTARKLYRFKVAFNCPSKFDTGIVQGPISSSPRRRRFQQPTRELPRAIEDVNQQLDPVVPKPKARALKRRPVNISVPRPCINRNYRKSPKSDAKCTSPNNITFGNQYIVEGETLDLYGLSPQQKATEVPVVAEPDQSEGEIIDPDVGLVPYVPVENKFAPKESGTRLAARQVPRPAIELSSSKLAWHLNRGLHIAKGKGEINYNTFTYRKWQNVIARVRKNGQTIEDAIKVEAPKGELASYQKVGSVLLNYGGLK